MAGRVAEAIFKAAVRRLPLEVRYPDGTVLGKAGRARAHVPRHDHEPAGGVRRPARRRRADRPGRVLHGRRLGRRRPHRRDGGLRRPRRDAGARAAAEAARALPAAPAAEGTQHRAEHPLQHLPALRPLQRALRHVPGPDHDATPARCSRRSGEALQSVAWDGLAAAQQAKIDRLLDKAGVGEGTRVLEIGTGWGELALRAAAARRHRLLRHPLQRAAGTGPQARRRRRLRRRRHRSSSRTTAPWRASTTPSSPSK